MIRIKYVLSSFHFSVFDNILFFKAGSFKRAFLAQFGVGNCLQFLFKLLLPGWGS